MPIKQPQNKQVICSVCGNCKRETAAFCDMCAEAYGSSYNRSVEGRLKAAESYDWDSLIGRELKFINIELKRLVDLIEKKDKELEILRTSEDYYRTQLGLKEVLEKEND